MSCLIVSARVSSLVTGALWKDKPRYMFLNKLITGHWISPSGVWGD